MSVACRLSPQQRKSVCQSATSEARTARIAPPGRPARDTVVGPRPADALWTYNAQTLGQLRADTPRIPVGRSLPRRDRGARRQAPARRDRELKMPSSDFFLRGVAIQAQRSASSPRGGRSLDRLGSAPVARATQMGRPARRFGPPPVHHPKKSEGVDLSRRRTIGAAP
jgi:hypothetical protein